MFARDFRTIPLALALLALTSLPSTVKAQGNTFNPYGNSGYADYREFGTPMYSNNPALPGQSRLNSEPLISRPRANSYQQYTEGLDGDSSSQARGGSSNLPYYQAYQQLNQKYNRVYRPNDSPANRKYEERLRLRDAAYAKAFAETDPAKRAKLLRQIDQEARDNPLNSPRPRPSTATTVPSRTGTQPTSRAPAPRSLTAPLPPGERRVPAPSPFPSTNTRRPATSATSPRGTAPSRPRTTTNPRPETDATSRPAPDPSTIALPPL
jgi:hypothetical protein